MDGPRQIIFHNNSGRDGDYALFMAFPHIYCEDNGAMRTAAWITRYVPEGAHDQIDIEENVYAWHKLETSPFTLGSVVEDGTAFPVTLGSNKTRGSSFKTHSNTLVPVRSAAAEGQFEIHASPSPSAPELIGVGKRGDDGSIVPVTAVQATPGFSYGICPQPVYFLARFDSVRVGQLVDLRASWKKACIDFSRPEAQGGRSQAIVTALANGRFSVAYRAPAPRPASLPVRGGSAAAGGLASVPSIGSLSRQPHMASGGLRQDRWSGEIGWPDSASTASVIQGSGMVIDALSAKYGWSVNTWQTESGGVGMKVYFWLREGRQPDYLYEEDWASAVRGLIDQSGLRDLGCFPHTPYGSFSRLAVLGR